MAFQNAAGLSKPEALLTGTIIRTVLIFTTVRRVNCEL
jgi:hypothetical protein